GSEGFRRLPRPPRTPALRARDRALNAHREYVVFCASGEPTPMSTRALAPVLTPRGRLLLAEVEDAPALPVDLSHRLQEAFARGPGHGLLQLGAAEVETPLPAVYGYWREIGGRYVTAVCTRPDIDEGREA